MANIDNKLNEITLSKSQVTLCYNALSKDFQTMSNIYEGSNKTIDFYDTFKIHDILSEILIQQLNLNDDEASIFMDGLLNNVSLSDNIDNICNLTNMM